MKMKKRFWILIALTIGQASLAVAKTPDPYQRGRELYLKGQYSEALALYQKALKQDKKNWVVLEAIGDVYISLGRKVDAIPYYEQALDAHPDNPTLEYFLTQPPLNPVPPLTTPLPYPNLRTLELSISAGMNFPIRTDHILRNWTQGIQESIYCGLQVSPEWAAGIQVDFLEPTNNPVLPLPPLTPTQTPNGNSNFYAGNFAVVGKVYPFSAKGDVPLYLIGGGGIYADHLGSAKVWIWDTSTQTNTEIQTPEELDTAASLQWGLGLPIAFTPYSKLLLDCRFEYVFTEEPLYFGSVNIGGMLFF